MSVSRAPASPQWRCRTLGPRMRLFQAEGEKFKTCTVRVYLHTPLEQETVTSTALVPYVLGRGCRGFPNLTAVNRRLEELYGASVGAGVTKIGEIQSLFLGLDVVQGRYLTEDVLPGAVDLLGRMCLDPTLDASGHFPVETVDQEKENVARRIRGLMNDKIRYAALRCIEEMCREEPYALNGIGRLEDLDALTPADITARWRQLLGTAPVDVFAVGGGQALEDLLAEALGALRPGARDMPATRTGRAPAQPRQVTEVEAIQQGKLCLGYRTDVIRTDPRYPAMLMYNGILGSFPHSKLFRNVREKASLAYYASSQWDALKGVLLVQSGIEADRYGEALAIIEQQVKDLALGQIDEDEMEFTRRGLANHLRAAEDSPYSLLDTAVGQSLVGDLRPVGERLKEIDAVTRDQIVEVAQGVHLDTIYFLGSHDPARTEGSAR